MGYSFLRKLIAGEVDARGAEGTTTGADVGSAADGTAIDTELEALFAKPAPPVGTSFDASPELGPAALLLSAAIASPEVLSTTTLALRSEDILLRASISSWLLDSAILLLLLLFTAAGGDDELPKLLLLALGERALGAGDRKFNAAEELLGDDV